MHSGRVGRCYMGWVLCETLAATAMLTARVATIPVPYKAVDVCTHQAVIQPLTVPLLAMALVFLMLRACHRMSTYQAMQAGASLDAKKRTGKKCFNPNAMPGASPLHGGAGFGMASGLRADPLTALEVRWPCIEGLTI